MRTLALAIAVAVAAATSSAAAADPSPEALAEASALYERGSELHAAGKHLEAARTFARADELVPDAAALEAALVAVLETDEAVLGMVLASRTTREPYRTRHIELADQARARFANAVGRIVAHCDGCRVTVDGAMVAHGVATWVRVGDHRVVLEVDGKLDARDVHVEPTTIVTVEPRETLPEPAPLPGVSGPTGGKNERPTGGENDSTGLSPLWFWIGLGVTGAAGAGTIASAVDTANLHADFVAAPNEALAADGEQAEIRTNALLGVTIGLAAVSGLLAAFTDWSGPPAEGSATARPTGKTPTGLVFAF